MTLGGSTVRRDRTRSPRRTLSDVIRRLLTALSLAVVVLMGSVLVAPVAGAELAGAARRPGVYVGELAAFGAGFPSVPTGIPLFIGAGESTRPLSITDPSELGGTAPKLRAAVGQFFDQCEPTCPQSVRVFDALTSSTSIAAAMDDPSVLASVIAGGDGPPDLYLAPALASMDAEVGPRRAIEPWRCSTRRSGSSRRRWRTRRASAN